MAANGEFSGTTAAGLPAFAGVDFPGEVAPVDGVPVADGGIDWDVLFFPERTPARERPREIVVSCDGEGAAPGLADSAGEGDADGVTTAIGDIAASALGAGAPRSASPAVTGVQ